MAQDKKKVAKKHYLESTFFYYTKLIILQSADSFEFLPNQVSSLDFVKESALVVFLNVNFAFGAMVVEYNIRSF